MKGIFIAFGFLVLVGYVGLKSGWFTMEDPKQALQSIQTQVKPGMTWEQVVDINQPRKVTPVSNPDSEVASSPMEFRIGLHTQWVEEGNYPYGFIFEYHFSQSDAIAVHFDNQGVVTHTRKVFTAGDLFNGTL